MRKLFTILFFIIWAVSVSAQITFSKESLNFGSVSETDTVTDSIDIFNDSGKDMDLSILPLCSCINFVLTTPVLKAGSAATVVFNLDPTNESGEIEKRIMITATDGLGKSSKSLLFAYADIQPSQNDIEFQDPAHHNSVDGLIGAFTPAAERFDILLFYSENCGSCRELIKNLLEKYEKTYDLKLYDIINDESSYSLMLDLLKERNTEASEFPILVFGDSVLQGEKDIERELESVIAGNKPYISDVDRPVALTFFASIIAGLGDGINPCAFATLIFLLSALSYIGKRKKEILITGIMFTIAVFVAYFLVGLGVFQVLRVLNNFAVISCILIWIIALLLLVLALFSFIDIIKVKSGKSSEMLLQLPKKAKQLIHKVIRERIRSAALIGSSLVLGFLVSIFELGCTGQIYFPYLSYLLKNSASSRYVFFLLLYNAGFITPLLLVFILTYYGLSNDSLTAFFKKHLLAVKIGTFVLFAGLLILIVFTNSFCIVFTVR